MSESGANAPSARGVAVLVDCCPICEKGPVRKKGSAEDDELYACDTCGSDLRENIFGFRYVSLDPRFEKFKASFLGQTFTKGELEAVCEKLRMAATAAVKAVPAEAAAERPAATSVEEELWWTLDEEEVARRKAAAGSRKDVTVEDLLSEVKQKRPDKK